MVRAARWSVCFVEQHVGRNKVLLRHLTNWQPIAAEVEDVINNPHPHALMTDLRENWLDICHSPRSSSSTSYWCTRGWVTGDDSVPPPPPDTTDPSVTSDFLRTLWTNRLPPNIQAIIATQVQVALEDVAQLADKIACHASFRRPYIFIWWWNQYINCPYWQAGSTSNCAFCEPLSSAFTIADMMARNMFVTFCRRVTSPWRLLVAPQF